MSDKTHDVEEQLFDSDVDEVVEDHANDSEEENEEPSEDEQEQDLDLSDPEDEKENKETSTADASRLKQIDAFQKRVNSGEIASKKDLPKAQKWMAKYLKFPDKEPEVDINSLKDELLNTLEMKQKEKEEASRFEELKSATASTATAAQKAAINEEYKNLVKNGMAKLAALETANRLAGVDLSGKMERMKAMRIPSAGTLPKSKYSPSKETDFADDVKYLGEEKAFRELQNLYNS